MIDVEISEEQVRIIEHTLGLDWKKIKYRNHYSNNKNQPESPITKNLEYLKSIGYMDLYEDRENCEYDVYFVTESGEKCIKKLIKLRKIKKELVIQQ